MGSRTICTGAQMPHLSAGLLERQGEGTKNERVAFSVNASYGLRKMLQNDSGSKTQRVG